MRRSVVRSAAVLVVLSVSLSGCWLQPGFGPEHQRWNRFEDQLAAADVASLHQVWVAYRVRGTGGEVWGS